jgi:dipeptidyl aminopeptidase/acylaminoacyl peptidase
VTRGPLTEGQGAWSPDGRYIYYREDRPDGSDIWRVPDRGGEAERVTQAGGYNPLPLADGRTLLYTRARFRAPLVSRSLETGVEREIVECVLGRDFDAAAGGLFYVACPEANDRYPLYRLDHTTGRRQLLARLGETNLDGIAVSPLGQTVLYVDVTVESELVLVENFQ